MRLIDADKFERDLSSVWEWLVKREIEGCGTTHGESLDKVHDILIGQPTAYDIDKVIKALETSRADYHSDSDYGVAFGLRLAIEIVKEGGAKNGE